MIIDTHCHIDMLESPEAYLRKQEQDGGITIGNHSIEAGIK